ncbi:7197_t:CDS:2 [Rhizophagus irregularis]|nr:7197_t:CDS:2 [Rhizophagus irregularis]
MSQITPKLTYQVNLPKSLEIEEDYYSPIFGTNNMFWRIFILLEDDDYYGLYLQPVANQDEIIWGERSKLTFNLFAKEIRNDNQIIELYSKSFAIPPGTPIDNANFDNIEYNQSKTYYPEPIPKDLIDAWKEHLFNFQSADVEFDVQGEKFYACSSILSKRSEYFEKMLSGHWFESTLNNSTCQIKHRIQISTYSPITISAMLKYFYTNQIQWTNEDNDDSIAIELFRLADQYVLLDLRERAKTRILDELTISNVSKIMFNLVPNYNDLKKPVLNFMAINFEENIKVSFVFESKDESEDYQVKIEAMKQELYNAVFSTNDLRVNWNSFLS